MLYGDMKSHLWEKVRDVTTAKQENIGRILNAAMRVAAGKRRWSSLIMDDQTLALTASTKKYYLPVIFDAIIECRINGESRELETMALNIFEESYPTYKSDAESTPEILVDLGLKPIKAAVSTKIKVMSSSASDTASTQQVRVVGVSGGNRVEEWISVNGTTAVTSSNTYTDIISLNKADECAGILTITDEVGTTTLAEIPPKENFSSYRQVMVYPTPDTDVSMFYSARRKVYDMVYDSDIPADLIDEDFSNMILGIAEQILTKDPDLGNLTVTHAMSKDKRTNNQPMLRVGDFRESREGTHFGRTLGG